MIMKKITALVLTLILALSFSTVAYAADDTKTEVPASATKDVKVVVDSSNAQDDTTEVYKIVITWDSLDFTYTFDESDVWDPATHKYSNTGTDGWDKTSANVKVTNHSNRPVDISAAIDVATKNEVTASLTNDEFTLATAVGTAVDSAPNDTIVVGVSGVPNVESDFTIGTVTVSIAKPTK